MESGATQAVSMNPSEYYVMGLVLTVEGIFGMLFNGGLLVIFLTNDSLRRPPSLLGISQCIGDFGISLMCPFAAISSFKESWLYGDQGCQLYALAGMLFGTVSITSLVSLAVDKYYSAIGNIAGSKPYLIATSAIWVNAFFWALTPLAPIGWGRYGIEPQKTTCMLDFADHEASYLTYLAAMVGVVYVVPMGVVLWCFVKLQEEGPKENLMTKVAKNEAAMTCLVVLLFLVIYWGAYGIVALWAAADDIGNVPLRLVAAAPLLAKICPIGNVAFQVLTNQNIRGLKGEGPSARDKKK